MKRKLLSMAVALLCSIGTWAENAYQTYLTTEKGWTQVTDLSSMTLSDYYFAIVSNDNTDLMIALDAGVNNTGNHALWYKDAKDPIKDNTYLWIIENNNTEGYVGYTFRNVDYNKRVLQTNDGENYFCRTNWEQGAVRWSSYACTLSDGAYTIQTLANGGTNYLGLWYGSDSDQYVGYVNGQEVAGNKSGANIGKFLFYAIPRTTAVSLATAASDATAASPYELGYLMFGQTKDDYTGATGLYEPGGWGSDEYNKFPEKYNDNAAPSTGDKVTKNITNAPNGYHKITVIANAAWISGRGSVGTTVPTTNDNSTVVTINGVSQNVPVRTDGSYNPVTLTFHTLVTDGNISFKITNNDAAAFWFVWNVEDTFYGVPSATNNIDLTGTPVSMTGKITNPDIETDGDVAWNGTVTGWNYSTGASNHGTLTGNGFTGHAFENWKSGGLNDGKIYQTLTSMPDGVYKLDLKAMVRTAKNQKVYVTSNGVTYATTVTAAAATVYSVYAIAEGGTMEIGLDINNSGIDWCAIDDAALTYYGTSAEAYALVHTQELGKVSSMLSSMASSSLKTAVQGLYDANSSASTVSAYITAIGNLNPFSNFNAEVIEAGEICPAADAIAAVAYEETSTGSHTIFTNAISTFSTTILGATAASTINSAATTLKAAIKTYINGAEPANEGEYFDITCLIINPTFADNNKDGWTETHANPTGGWEAAQTKYGCNEYFQNTFDIHQEITGLPDGSYSLLIKAFQRPGSQTDVYTAYNGGTNNVTAKVYVNSDESLIKNIMEEKKSSRFHDGDAQLGSEGSYEYVPDTQESASAWFEAGNYDASVAALVNDGSLTIGFKNDTYVASTWTIFDDFRLRYYGSSKMIYLKQYLPQLRTEVSADLANGAYANVLTSSEDEALDAALIDDPDEETEEAYQTVIDNLLAAQTAFRSAATSYDAMVAAKASSLTKISTNIGTGVFQYNETTNNTLYSAYETAKETVDGYTFTTASTAAGAQALVDALDDAIEAYNNQPLNAPEASKRYNVSIVDGEQAWDGNAVTFIAGGRDDMGGYAIQYLAPANEYMNQALKFTAVAGEANTYKVSAINVEDGGERYITTGSTYSGNNTQIRTTDDASKASWVKIQATATPGQFQLLNVSDGNKVIGRNSANPDNGMYTDGNVSFTIAEASQASVTVSCKAGKYGTVIFPFTPDVRGFDGIKFYSTDGVNSVTQKVQLTEVAEPEANVPYLIKNEGGEIFSTAVTGWGIAGADSYTEGLLTGVYTAATIAAGENHYVLQTQNDVQAFYIVDNKAFTATAYKCYMTYSAGGTVKFLGFDFGDATGISEIANGEQPTANSTIFNLAGQRVSKAQKGLYIVNGKKVSVK